MSGTALGALLLAVGCLSHPAERHIGKWSAPPQYFPAKYITDSPFVGNGDAGASFGGSPNETTFHIGSNSFWSSNVAPDAQPASGSEYYTQIRLGELSLQLPDLSPSARYSATQEIYRARINASYDDGAVHHSTFIAPGDNIMVTRVTAVRAMPANISLSTGAPWKYGPPLPSASGVVGSAGWIEKASVTTTENSMGVAKCYVAGQGPAAQHFVVGDAGEVRLADGRCLTLSKDEGADGTQRKVTAGKCGAEGGGRWVLTKTQSNFTLLGNAACGEVLREVQCATTWGCPEEVGKACLATEGCQGFEVGRGGSRLCGAATGKEAHNTNMWVANSTAGYAIRDTQSGLCLGLVKGMHAGAVPCGSAALFSHNTTSGHLFLSGGARDGWEDAWRPAVSGGPQCLTAVRPNPKVVGAAALRVQKRGGGAVYGMAVTADGRGGMSVAFHMEPQVEYEVLVAMVYAGDCRSCPPATPPAHTQALALLQTVGTTDKLEVSHTTWWADYWNMSSIDLGPAYTELEAFYYGMQYQIGSATRPGKTPPGLWGPWIQTDMPGWHGDYTTNYNFEAGYYGMFSDNRPHLAEPLVPIVLGAVEQSRWRASFRTWNKGPVSEPPFATSPGLDAMDFDHMDQVNPDGAPAGYKGLETVTHLSPWPWVTFNSDWGQKNIAAFLGKTFIDIVDFTQNKTFLASTAYPYIRDVGDFYESYLHFDGSTYSVMHSCAQEQCSYQGPHTGGNILVSNNSPFDLAFVKRIFRKLLEWSEVLQVDLPRRAKWEDILDKVAPYPLTRNEDGAAVFAQATLNPTPYSPGWTGGFPNRSQCDVLQGGQHASQCGNARYPIVYFNAMHPGEDIDLAAPEDVLSVARQTIEDVNWCNAWSPTNGLCMAWPPAARVPRRNSTAELFSNFAAAVRATMLPNFTPFILNRPNCGYGCNIENSGATVAVNDLLASVHGHGSNASLRLLPGGLPNGYKVAFDKIRVKGAFLVSAQAVGTPCEEGAPCVAFPDGVEITSLAGGVLAIWWEGDAPTARDTTASRAVPLVRRPERPSYTMNTTAGHRYRLSLE